MFSQWILATVSILTCFLIPVVSYPMFPSIRDGSRPSLTRIPSTFDPFISRSIHHYPSLSQNKPEFPKPVNNFLPIAHLSHLIDSQRSKFVALATLSSSDSPLNAIATVYVSTPFGTTSLCVGGKISDRFILTTASCAFQRPHATTIFGNVYKVHSVYLHKKLPQVALLQIQKSSYGDLGFYSSLKIQTFPMFDEHHARLVGYSSRSFSRWLSQRQSELQLEQKYITCNPNAHSIPFTFQASCNVPQHCVSIDVHSGLIISGHNELIGVVSSPIKGCSQTISYQPIHHCASDIFEIERGNSNGWKYLF